MHGHGHPTLHVVHVLQGGFVEQTPGGWIECGVGMYRISPPGASHHLVTNPEGCHLQIVEVGFDASRRISGEFQKSAFLRKSSLNGLSDNYNKAFDSGDTFAIEYLSLELAAQSLLPKCEIPPNWLIDLRSELLSLDTHTYSLDKLSSKLQRHRSHVARAFRKYFGQSAGDLVRNARLEESKKRLLNFHEPIVQIACDLGFSDQAHFCKLFRQRFGLSPTGYRQSLIAPNATLIQDSNQHSAYVELNATQTSKGLHAHS
jgi:AraC-like DNA-binding protein